MMADWPETVPVLRFTLPLEPTAQERARHRKNGWSYKSAKQKAHEADLEAALLPYVPERPLEGAVSVVFRAYMSIPKSTSKRKRKKLSGGQTPYTNKPDIDNVEKQLLDAMTRLNFWKDDKQVFSVSSVKLYGESPCWSVVVGVARNEE